MSKKVEAIKKVIAENVDSKLPAEEQLAKLVGGPGDWPIDSIEELRDAIASLTRRLDLLYRYTVGDTTGWRYPVPSFALPDARPPDVFPAPDYEQPGGPRKPAGAP